MAAEENTNIGERLMGWRFAEYPDQQRSVGAWLALIAVGIILLIIALVTGNFLFALIIILAGIIYILQQRNQARLLEFGIHDNGISVGKDHFRYRDIDRFWIVYKPGDVQNLYFHFRNAIRPYIAIPLGDANPLRVRDFLGRYLLEDLDQEDEPATEEIARHLKI